MTAPRRPLVPPVFVAPRSTAVQGVASSSRGAAVPVPPAAVLQRKAHAPGALAMPAGAAKPPPPAAATVIARPQRTAPALAVPPARAVAMAPATVLPVRGALQAKAVQHGFPATVPPPRAAAFGPAPVALPVRAGPLPIQRAVSIVPAAQRGGPMPQAVQRPALAPVAAVAAAVALPPSPAQASTLQLVAARLNRKRRHGFMGHIGRARKAIVGSLPQGMRAFDMAHRLSYKDIRDTVHSGTPQEVRRMIRAVTIPRRRFGGVEKGNTVYYRKARRAYLDGEYDRLVSILNSSPYNLRPGNSSRNRSIGARADLHYRSDGTLTPQSRAVARYASLNNQESSDYLNRKLLKLVEEQMTALIEDDSDSE